MAQSNQLMATPIKLGKLGGGQLEWESDLA